MKNFFTLAAIAVTTFVFAQEENNNNNAPKARHTVAVNGMMGDPSQFGLSYEFGGAKATEKGRTSVVNLSYGLMNIDEGLIDVDGNGFVIELGHKNYFNKETLNGFYLANYLSYGNIKFDEETTFGDIEGTYSYFSFFSPEVGYKIALGNFSIDPFIGIMWKLEIKGKGDIDNNYTDEWAPRAGVKVGYNF